MKRTRPTRLLPCAKKETVLIQIFFFGEPPVAFPGRAAQDTMITIGKTWGKTLPSNPLDAAAPLSCRNIRTLYASKCA